MTFLAAQYGTKTVTLGRTTVYLRTQAFASMLGGHVRDAILPQSDRHS